MAKERNGKEGEQKVGQEKEGEEKPKAAQEKLLPRKKNSKLILVFLILILLGASCAAAYFFFGDLVPERFLLSSNGSRALANKAASVEGKKAGSAGPILTLDPFIFNLAGNSSRFAKVSLAISLQNAKAFEEAKKIVPILRDKALMVLSAKSAEELIDVTKRDSIKIELQNRLKDVFKEKEDLESVYITDIIIP